MTHGDEEAKPKISSEDHRIMAFINRNRRLLSAATAAKSLQSCPTLCDPKDSSPPGSPVPGLLQARTLKWVAISFSNAWKWKVKVKSLSRVRLFMTPWTTASQAPPSMGFSRQEYWSGVPSPSPAGPPYRWTFLFLFLLGKKNSYEQFYTGCHLKGMG